MTLKTLYNHWRHSALHATLVIRSVMPFNNAERDVIQMDSNIVTDSNTVRKEIKMHGKSADGPEIYITVEVMGTPEMLKKYNFMLGGHAGFVLRVID